MPQLDVTTFSSQIFWLLVTFTALFLIMWRISVPKISDALEARQKRIDDNLLRAEELKKDAEAALDAYEIALAQAHSEAQKIILEANTKLIKESQSSETKLNEALAKRVEETERKIAASMSDAITQIRAAATEVATNAVERISGEKLDPADAATAVDTAIQNRRQEV